MESFSQLAIEHAPWSMSKASLAENCPLSFNLKYKKKLREKEAPQAADARIGRAVHRLLEETIKGTLARNDKPGILKICMQERLTTPEMEEALSYLHNVYSFSKRLGDYSARHGVEKTFVEKSFGFTEALQAIEPNKSFFRGVWDLALLVKDQAIIIDHKTGDIPTNVSPFEKHQLQYRCYAIAAWTQFPHIQGVRMAFHYVSQEQLIWSEPDPISRVKGEYLPWYVQFVNRCAAQIPDSLPKKSWFCNYCGYTHLCPIQRKEE